MNQSWDKYTEIKVSDFPFSIAFLPKEKIDYLIFPMFFGIKFSGFTFP